MPKLGDNPHSVIDRQGAWVAPEAYSWHALARGAANEGEASAKESAEGRRSVLKLPPLWSRGELDRARHPGNLTKGIDSENEFSAKPVFIEVIENFHGSGRVIEGPNLRIISRKRSGN